MEFLKLCCMLFMLTLSHAASAQWVVSDVSPKMEISGRIDLTYQAPRHADGESIFGKALYAETSIVEDVAGTLAVYHDKTFWSVAPGVAKTLGNFQLGLNVGIARITDQRCKMGNPWLWFGDEERGIEAYLHGEFYSCNQKEKPFYRGYFWKRWGNYMLGLSGDSIVGVGPGVGKYLGKNTRLHAYLPLAFRPKAEEERMRVVVGLTYEFKGL